MERGFIAATAFGLAYAVACHHAAFAVIDAFPEEGQMLCIQFPAQRPVSRVKRRHLVAFSPESKRLKYLNLFNDGLSLFRCHL